MNTILYSGIGEQVNFGFAGTASEALNLAHSNGYTGTRADSELLEYHTEMPCGAERVWVVYA